MLAQLKEEEAEEEEEEEGEVYDLENENLMTNGMEEEEDEDEEEEEDQYFSDSWDIWNVGFAVDVTPCPYSIKPHSVRSTTSLCGTAESVKCKAIHK